MASKLEELPLNQLDAMVTRLELQKERLEQSIAEMKSERGRVIEDLTRARNALNKRSQKPEGPRVTNHALLRFLERITQISVQDVERMILSADNVAAIEAGATRITANGITLVIKDKAVVTVLEG